MAKRKKEDPVAELLMWLLIMTICVAFYVTQSLVAAAFIGISLFVMIIIVQNIFRLRKEAKIRDSGILQVDKMSGIQFEEYLRILYSTTGYKVKTTPKSGDFGADLILEKGAKRIAVQAKRHKEKVGIKAVQEVRGAKDHYNATEVWVVTNSNFTQAAEKLAKSNNVLLIGREQLIAYSLNAKKANEVSSQKVKGPAN